MEEPLFNSIHRWNNSYLALLTHSAPQLPIVPPGNEPDHSRSHPPVNEERDRQPARSPRVQPGRLSGLDRRAVVIPERLLRERGTVRRVRCVVGVDLGRAGVGVAHPLLDRAHGAPAAAICVPNVWRSSWNVRLCSSARSSAGGGMRCPLASHNCWLPWNRKYTKGTQTHGDPAVSFRVSPTYILSDPLENFIAGRKLVADALRGKWKKAETFRLGYENSEDAVSWNVFRALQEAGNLELAARVLSGIDITGDRNLSSRMRRSGVVFSE